MWSLLNHQGFTQCLVAYAVNVLHWHIIRFYFLCIFNIFLLRVLQNKECELNETFTTFELFYPGTIDIFNRLEVNLTDKTSDELKNMLKFKLPLTFIILWLYSIERLD